MTTKTELLAELSALQAKINAMPDDDAGVWVPEIRSDYYHYDENGIWHVVGWNNDRYDQARLARGNVFRTHEEAKAADARIVAGATLHRLTKGFVPDWKNRCQNKWVVSYDHSDQMLSVDVSSFWQCHPGPYFASEADAEAAKASNADDFKIFLGVV